VTSRHHVRRASDAAPIVPAELAEHSTGFRRWSVIGEDTDAVHTGFGLSELDPGGRVGSHVHSFEETLFVLEGDVVVRTTEGAFLL
jgi:quercetin dioxygenase-like cupin family protein